MIRQPRMGPKQGPRLVAKKLVEVLSRVQSCLWKKNSFPSTPSWERGPSLRRPPSHPVQFFFPIRIPSRRVPSFNSSWSISLPSAALHFLGDDHFRVHLPFPFPLLPQRLKRARAQAEMASTNGGYTTGAAHDSADVRRRNVQGFEKSNGDVTQSRHDRYDDVKKSQKVCLQ